MLTKFRQLSIKRIVAAFLLILFFFSVLSIRLFFVQVISAQMYSELQTDLMTKDIPITATRGDILDRNLNILASDASCSMITVYPNDIAEGNDENVSRYLSEQLGLDYDSVYSKVSNKKMNNLVIQRGVDNTTALAIREAEIPGIVITEDKKRYYSDSTSAQYILGFVGADHSGLYGIESIYNDELSGEDGYQKYLTDSTGHKIESGASNKVDSVPGNDIVLTIDRNIQYYVEKAVYEAYLRLGAKRIVAIVTDPKTNAVLAAAVYPAFDLENAWALDSDYANSFSAELSGKTLGEQQLEMWKNPITSLIYEPGSTFKTITVSSALEAGVVSLNSSFYCSGFARVDSVTYKCHVFPRGHGSETLTDAVVNSCNPAMMQIAQRMGTDTFYSFIHNYGFGAKTGIQLDGEEKGLLYNRTKLVDFVTLGYGQGLGVTPVQMVSALNAVINGGHLYKPIIVDSVVNSVTKQVIEKNSPTLVRNVISEETSSKMRTILSKAAAATSGLKGYESLKIGGKTGTAQKVINGAYSHNAVVANFYGFAPYDDPKYSVLVLVDEPTGSATMGSTAAAPIAAQIFSSILGKRTSETEDGTNEATAPIIPDLRGRTVEQAVNVLDAIKIPYTFTQAGTVASAADSTAASSEGVPDDQNATIIAQSAINEAYDGISSLELTYVPSTGANVIMADLTGMNEQQVKTMFESLGLKLDAVGGGICVSQSKAAGTLVEKGTKVSVVFKYVE